ncbi:hypothetical protein AVEN_194783-1 [Araneus ventricosus]|uniref:Uncharacterized protein n=1 Tax=Araneus ventricosus TaxID=182803 RepID=A0A4Y2B2V8_ARAVE|nr:hypothetical protein AVEN_194783-1 [Araneus ventricosus]
MTISRRISQLKGHSVSKLPKTTAGGTFDPGHQIKRALGPRTRHVVVSVESDIESRFLQKEKSSVDFNSPSSESLGALELRIHKYPIFSFKRRKLGETTISCSKTRNSSELYALAESHGLGQFSHVQ